MEGQKLVRNGYITQLDEVIGQIKTELEKEEKNWQQINIWKQCVLTYDQKLKELGELLINHIVEVKPDGIDEELRLQRRIEMKIQEIRLISEPIKVSVEKKDEQDGGIEDACEQLKLPKKVIQKFDGDLNNWISWWNSFEAIHQSKKIANKLKFDYLVDALQPGSRAMEVVKGFARTAENYQKAVDLLTKVYGDPDEITNALTTAINRLLMSKDKMPFIDLYYQLMTKIQELESLGVEPRSMVASPLLYGPVYGILKEDRKLSWKRYYSSLDDATRKENSKLRLLLDWLQEEVIHEKSEEFMETRKRALDLEDHLPTAVQLVDFQQKRRKTDYRKCCAFCEKPHPTADCYYPPKSLEDRKRKLQQKQLCFNCFRDNHRSYECKDQVKCKACGGSHQKVMCDKKTGRKGGTPRKVTLTGGGRSVTSQKTAISKDDDSKAETTQQLSSVVTVPASNKGSPGRQVPLQTLMTKLVNEHGKEMIVRTLIDSGAQRSALLSSIAMALNLRSRGCIPLRHKVYGGGKLQRQHHIYAVDVLSLGGDYTLKCEVVDEIEIVDGVPNASNFMKTAITGVELSDNDETISNIQLLLGNDVYGRILTGEAREIDTGLWAIRTKLGWVLSGIASEYGCESITLLHTVSLLNVGDIKHLWELDTLGIRDPIQSKSKLELDEEVKAHFLKTVSRNDDGRYEIELPWVRPKEKVACNFFQARKRLDTATGKLREKELITEYDAVFQEWLIAGIIEEVCIDEQTLVDGYFLPHRAVIKTSSETTKIRPVFDASCKSPSGLSLNDCLAKGPNLIELIPDILIRFRLRTAAAVSDIGKAFLQIAVNERDCEFLKFLWWEQDWKTLKVYRHKRVVFGVNSSPFELAAVIERHLSQEEGIRKNTAVLLKNSLYVDNCVVSMNTKEELEKFKRESIELMAEAKMELRLWKNNIDEIDQEERIAVLGVEWNRQTDTLQPKINRIILPERLTKRVILAVAQSVFDPMGMYAPVLLIPKLLLRELHDLKLGWDDDIPLQFDEQFRKACCELEALSLVEIPRQLAPGNPGKHIQVHVFGDASKDAYATAVFTRIKVGSQWHVQLLMAKARVAPKNATIPRLELLAATIAARLGDSVLRALRKAGIEATVNYWSDSKTALTWIRQDNNWGIFINNRVAEIRLLSRISDWRFVPGIQNPADLPSRGCKAQHLVNSKWWLGPEWLKMNEETWPQEVFEEPRAIEITAVTIDSEPWYSKYAEFEKNVRHVAYTLRTNQSQTPLTVSELVSAELQLWKFVQRDSGVIDHIGRLTLEKNKDGLFCVKTRLECSSEDGDFSRPVYLPANHVIVQQFIMKQHLRNAHAPEGVMIVQLRRRFWIPGVRLVVRNTLKKCTDCRRFTAKSVQVPIAPLPKDRVMAERCFENTGVDLGGPLILRDGTKVWFVLFTCAVFRAVHLELVSSLTTAGFMMALRRFISRRGRPVLIYSDCGTNFVGLDNLMNNIDWVVVANETGVDRIRWKFNPPTSPWWGGWWERLVGIVKLLLKKNLGTAVVDYEELLTILGDIESVVNSRPLTKNFANNNDCSVLTPQLFLSLQYSASKGKDLKESDHQGTVVPDLDLIDERSLNQQFEARKSIMLTLRRRFVDEYLAGMTEYYKKIPQVQVKEKDLVLIGSDDKSRIYWPVAQVIELIKGKDGIIRLLRLKVKIGKKFKEILRPVQRIYPLEVDAAVSEGVNYREILDFVENQTDEIGNDVVTAMEGKNPVGLATKPCSTAIETKEKSNEFDLKTVTDKTEIRTRSGRVSKPPLRWIEELNGLKIIDDLN